SYWPTARKNEHNRRLFNGRMALLGIRPSHCLDFETAGKFLKGHEEKEQRQKHLNHRGLRGRGGKQQRMSFSNQLVARPCGPFLCVLRVLCGSNSDLSLFFSVPFQALSSRFDVQGS